MAAPCITVMRTVFRGARVVPGRWLLKPGCPTPTCCRLQLQSAPGRPLLVSAASSARTEARRGPLPNSTDPRTEEGEEEDQGPEYIPRRKAKNPMRIVAYAWMIGLPSGIIGFLLTKRQVDKNRLKQLKIRQRMRRAHDGEYEGRRSHRHTDSVKVDQ
ncbi:uncharacterized protein ACBR49_011670 [Aulostomus maculatus]